MAKKKDEIPDWVTDEMQNFRNQKNLKKQDIFLNFMMQITK